MKKKLMAKLKKLKPVHYLVIFFGVVIYFGAMIGVINYQNARKVANPPKLEITTPKDGDIVSPGNVTVQGISESKTEISVFDVKTDTDKKGNFSLTVPITKNQNNIKVIAQKNGLISEEVVNISVFVPKTVKKAPSKKVRGSNISSLNNSGPETFWVFEVGALSAAGAAWHTSRRRLRQAFRS